MKIFVLLDGIKPVEFFHSAQRAKKYAKAHNIRSKGSIIEVEVQAGLFNPLFRKVGQYSFKYNWTYKTALP